MKFFTTVILIALLSFLACLYLPWWTISLAAFVVILIIPQRPLYAFFSGFLAVFLLWSLLSYYISAQNDNLLAHKVSMIILKSNSPALLIFITALIGALVGGFAALASSYLRKAV